MSTSRKPQTKNHRWKDVLSCSVCWNIVDHKAVDFTTQLSSTKQQSKSEKSAQRWPTPTGPERLQKKSNSRSSFPSCTCLLDHGNRIFRNLIERLIRICADRLDGDSCSNSLKTEFNSQLETCNLPFIYCFGFCTDFVEELAPITAEQISLKLTR